jgi:dethiobiotin synthetase
MLRAPSIPGLFITGTDTDVGKTVIAGAIGRWFHHRGARVAVCKPAATGCVHRREGLVSEDAEFLAHCAGARFPLDVICPQRYLEPLAPAVAADRARQPLDWTAIQRSLDLMAPQSDILIVEGVGGVMVPMDSRHTILDMAGWLGLPVVVVARPSLGTINHTLLTLHALRNAGIPIAGVVVNRYPTDTPSAAEETNPRIIERWGKAPLLCTVPNERIDITLPAGIVAAIDQVDWARLAKAGKAISSPR